MAAREDEAIAPEPRRIGGILPQKALEQQVGGGGQAHRGARVAVAGLLDGIHGEGPDGGHGASVEVGPGEVRAAGQGGGSRHIGEPSEARPGAGSHR